MNSNEILGFLLPQLGDGLQLTFFLVILGLITATIASAHWMANPRSWEHKWNRGTPDDPTDDLEIGHGSVTDLWHAVATAPEKLAEIMPGMLLVVGLLGTFLGLGLALNHASSILGHANLADPGAAADSMQNLLGLLQGLGTKFKTSTWGILGFVFLKIWSEFTRFDEKRLAWVIGKVKNELELRKRTEAQEQQARQQALFKEIGGTAQHIVAGFGQQITALIKSNEALNLQQVAHLTKIEQGTDRIRSELGQVQVKIEQGSDGISADLVQVQTKIDKGTDGIRAELGQVQSKIEQGTGDICAELGQMQTETQAMRTAMTTFTDSTQKVVENMGAAAEGMASGADKVGNGATQLVNAVNAFESQFTDVLNDVRRDLSAAINNLSAEASVTLKEGSAQLKEATTEISASLKGLSTDVKETMSSVDTSINAALKIQENASIEFIQSSKELKISIAETTGIIGNLAEPIEEGLEAVSGSTRKIAGIAKAVETSTENLVEVVQQLKTLPAALAPLKNLTDEHKALLAMLKPLSETVKVQHAMLSLLEEIQRGRAPGEAVKVQQAMLNLLEEIQRDCALGETVKVQQAMLSLLKDIQRDRVPVQPVVAEKVVDLGTASDASVV